MDMKRILGMSLMVGALALMAAPKAEAALVGSFHVCQGGTCVNFAANTVPAGTIVGDYTLEASGASFESSAFSQTATTGIQIVRTGSTSGAALDVWYTVTGYTQPVGGGFVMTTTGSASKTGTATDSVSYTAWYSSTNSTGFPTGVLGGTGSCTPSASATVATTSCNGSTAPQSVGAGSALYSLITRTTFNISIGDG